MFRYNFVPLLANNNTLVIAVADPGMVILSDELPLLLGKKLAYKVATPRQIGDLLKRTEQSQTRAGAGHRSIHTGKFRRMRKRARRTISGDRLTRDTTVSPGGSPWWKQLFSRRWSGARVTFTLRLVTRKWRVNESTGLTACCSMLCSLSPRSGTPRFFRASRLLSDLDIAERVCRRTDDSA